MEKYTKYEIARIIGARALQIAMNAPLLLKIEKSMLEKVRYDPTEIARLEFESGILPITVKRPFPKKLEEEKEEKIIEEEEKILETVEEGETEKKEEAEEGE